LRELPFEKLTVAAEETDSSDVVKPVPAVVVVTFALLRAMILTFAISSATI